MVALVTDIGNDIMYGIAGNELIACLNSIFHTLQEVNASIFVTPIFSWFEREMSPAVFLLLRTLFYPKSRVSYQRTLTAIGEVNCFLKDNQGISLITGLETFAGWEKIHYGILKGRFAWTQIAGNLLRGTLSKNVRPISVKSMMASYKIYFRQLVFSDLLPFGTRGPDYF